MYTCTRHVSIFQAMPIKIFVGNVHCESSPSTEQELKKVFETYGTVVECDILTGKNYGFVVNKFKTLI